MATAEATPRLGGCSHKLSPPTEDNSRMSALHADQATSGGAADSNGPPRDQKAEDAKAPVPLILQDSFRQSVDSWDRHLQCPATKARLKSYCVVCGMWIACSKKIRQHYNRTHQHEYPHAAENALKLCASFKGHFTRGRSCRYCGSIVGAPCRHVQQCVVLWQLCVAVHICSTAKDREDDGPGPDRRDLCSLHAIRAGGGRSGSLRGDAGSEKAAPGTQQEPGSPSRRPPATPFGTSSGRYQSNQATRDLRTHRQRLRISRCVCSAAWSSNTRTN